MRSMANCKLVDCIKLPLKSVEDFHSALEYLLESGLSEYINKFLVPFIGDWPCQFFVRQIVFSEGIFILVPFIGPLHISLNARENVVHKFHPFFSELYSFLSFFYTHSIKVTYIHTDTMTETIPRGAMFLTTPGP